jgi:hypothetical protein
MLKLLPEKVMPLEGSARLAPGFQELAASLGLTYPSFFEADSLRPIFIAGVSATLLFRDFVRPQFL